MSTFVEQCRSEWKRLGVPDLLAEEMATELEADLAEAAADGVSAEELLGESDPRRFAAAWASERGIVSGEPPAKKRRKWPWIVLAVAVAFFLFVGGMTALAFGFLATTSVSRSNSPPIRVRGFPATEVVSAPSLVGLQACHGVRIATRAGLAVRPHQAADLVHNAVVDGAGYSCDAVVVRQRPAPGTTVRQHGRLELWLRRASD